MLLSKFRSVWAARVGAVCLCCLVAACATVFPREDDRPESVIVDGLDIAMMAHVMKVGFTEIRDRALESPTMDALFLTALEGLSSVDPSVHVTARDQDLLITYNDVPLPPVARPAHDDINAWIKTTLTTVLTLRQVSGPLKMANAEQIYKATFPPVLRTLDPFSRYAGHDDAIRSRLLREGVSGLGVGVIAATEGVAVQSMIKNGPAEQAGLRLDDVIIAIDGMPLRRMPLARAKQRLDGPGGSEVRLTVRRDKTDTLQIIARRRVVVPQTVTAATHDRILEIRINTFNQRTAHGVEKAVLDAIAEGPVEGIVLDLRSDPGGLLDQAVDLADLFLDSGTIITLRGRHPGAQQYYAARRGDIARGIPMAIILDGGAASAAEITAVALQDNRRAAVVGTVSLGKGSVQTLIRLPNEGEIVLTWSRAYTPRGAGLHGLGVLPDVCMSGEEASLSETIGRIFNGGALSAEASLGWNQPPADADGLAALRAACPPQARPDHAVDLAVARRLVSDPDLLAQVTQGRARQLAEIP